MPLKLAAAVIHGIGTQKPGFSASMIEEINGRLGNKSADVTWEEIYWADILSRRQDDYLRRANRNNQLDLFSLRRFVVSALGDASAYRKTTSATGNANNTYTQIHDRVRQAINHLENETGGNVPLVVFAHSLGCHIMSNYIWDMQQDSTSTLSNFQKMETLAGLVMFGCNVPLFVFAFDPANIIPIRFPGNALTPQQHQKARWYNFFDPDDILGYPLKPINAAYSRVVNRDYAINVGGVFSSWNPLSHNKYWTDNDFTRPTANFVRRFL